MRMIPVFDQRPVLMPLSYLGLCCFRASLVGALSNGSPHCQCREVLLSNGRNEVLHLFQPPRAG